MRTRDIYDDMPDGAEQRRRNKQRLAELEREGTARRARIAQVLALADLCSQAIQPPIRHAA
jgi:uncharacterized protein (DUF2384 family)